MRTAWNAQAATGLAVRARAEAGSAIAADLLTGLSQGAARDRLAGRASRRRCGPAFTALCLIAAGYSLARSLPGFA